MKKTTTTADFGRQLMIKTKACQRLKKEVAYYHQEVKENEGKLQEMKDQNKNPFDIKKFQEVLGESYMMVPDSQRRYEQALEELKGFLECHDTENDILTSEFYEPAKELLVQDLHNNSNNNNNNNNNTSAAFDDVIVQETDVSNIPEGEAF